MHAIEVEGMSKRYRLGQTTSTTLVETIPALLQRGRREPPQDIWALRDVDLTVNQGEVLGLIGRNGAGKSTLLKILARITEPTTGVTRTRGRVGALLDVGTGFHGELTGLENVFVNGALLGLSRREIKRRLDDIVAFAGVERFLNTPLKRYSSGMQLRLAFAIAAEIEPEIVVVDEVLAVGDAEFQRRCLGRMSDMQKAGRTVIFVSHDSGTMARLCSRVVWFDSGRVVADGPTQEVLTAYLQSGQDMGERVVIERGSARVVSPVAIEVACASRPGERPTRDEPLMIDVTLEASEAAPAIDLAVYLTSENGTRILDEAWSDRNDEPLRFAAGASRRVRLCVPPVLAAGRYGLHLWIGTAYDTEFDDRVAMFTLEPRIDDSAEAVRRPRVLQPQVGWSSTLLDGATRA